MNLRQATQGIIIIGAVLFFATGSAAHQEPPSGPASASPAPAPEAAKTVDDFHAAMARGDIPAMTRLLSDAVIIYEAGGAERSRAEYSGAHLPADIAFAKAVPGQLVRRNGGSSADIAWVASEGRTKGQFKGREVDRITTETMILRRTAGVWRIVHIHWSSRAASAAH